MLAIVRLLSAAGKFLGGAANFIQSVLLAFWMYGSHGDIEALRKDLNVLKSEVRALALKENQVAQEPTPLSAEIEQLYTALQHQMDLQYQVNMLSRYVLTFPSLPDEGF
jgi:hypothetical protein